MTAKVYETMAKDRVQYAAAVKKYYIKQRKIERTKIAGVVKQTNSKSRTLGAVPSDQMTTVQNPSTVAPVINTGRAPSDRVDSCATGGPTEKSISDRLDCLFELVGKMANALVCTMMATQVDVAAIPTLKSFAIDLEKSIKKSGVVLQNTPSRERRLSLPTACCTHAAEPAVGPETVGRLGAGDQTTDSLSTGTNTEMSVGAI